MFYTLLFSVHVCVCVCANMFACVYVKCTSFWRQSAKARKEKTGANKAASLPTEIGDITPSVEQQQPLPKPAGDPATRRRRASGDKRRNSVDIAIAIREIEKSGLKFFRKRAGVCSVCPPPPPPLAFNDSEFLFRFHVAERFFLRMLGGVVDFFGGSSRIVAADSEEGLGAGASVPGSSGRDRRGKRSAAGLVPKIDEETMSRYVFLEVRCSFLSRIILCAC